jgi:hypothetical protein
MNTFPILLRFSPWHLTFVSGGKIYTENLLHTVILYMQNTEEMEKMLLVLAGEKKRLGES